MSNLPSRGAGLSPTTGRMRSTGERFREAPPSPELPQDFVRRTGLVGWWLSLTAPPRPINVVSVPERERLRKAELASFSMLAIFAFLIALISNSLADPANAEAVGAMAICLIIAALLNRTGHTSAAAYLIPGAMMLLIALAILQEKGGLRLILMPAFDLFVIPTILVAFIGNRRAPWLFAAIAILFIVGTYLLEPHQAAQVNGISFDELAQEQQTFGVWGMLNRHVALLFFSALFGWMGARSVDFAIARADRAEELARLEHAYAEQSRQLQEGIRKIQETHVQIANGNYAARAPLNQEHILWQISSALNNLIQRLQRSVEAEHMLRRTELEISRLKEEIQRAKAGQMPIWPQPSGTPLDPIIVEFSSLRSGGSD